MPLHNTDLTPPFGGFGFSLGRGLGQSNNLFRGFLVLQRRFLDLVSFWAEIASQNARDQSCQACRLIAMRMCLRVLSCKPSL